MFPVVPVPDAVDTVVCVPDDGCRYNRKHIQQFSYKTNYVNLQIK
jgi:hypothetical protein